MRINSLLLVTVLAFSCAEKEKSEREAIRLLLDRLIDADNKKDIERVMPCYTKDAVLVPPGRPLIAGEAAIRSNYEGIFTAAAISLSIDVDSVLVQGQTGVAYGYTRGTVTAADGSSRQVEDRYIALVASVDGQWRITRLMWNPEQAAPLPTVSN